MRPKFTIIGLDGHDFPPTPARPSPDAPKCTADPTVTIIAIWTKSPVAGRNG